MALTKNKLAKSDFGEFTSMEKYIQLILMEHIWQSLKFDKPFLLPFKSITFQYWCCFTLVHFIHDQN